MQEPGAFDAIPLMVTPWNLPRIRDLGRFYLTEARGALSLMNEAIDAHCQAKQERKHEHQKSYEHFRLLALHTHSIACDLFLSDSTLGKEATLVQLVQTYHARGEQKTGPLCQLYEEAVSQLCALLLPGSRQEVEYTHLLMQALQQANLRAHRGRKRSPCSRCSRQAGEFCQRQEALLSKMNERQRSARQLLRELPAAESMSIASIRHLALACTRYIAAASSWHRHCFGLQAAES